MTRVASQWVAGACVRERRASHLGEPQPSTSAFFTATATSAAAPFVKNLHRLIAAVCRLPLPHLRCTPARYAYCAASLCSVPSRRRSSVAPRTGHFQDPRVITDKVFKKKAMDKIIRYLIEHDYDKQIFEKDLHSPTQKTFVSIISFLFKSAIPNFQFTDPNKLADEVQQLLKCLGYPCTIQKSHLTTIGAPNSWPNVLAALAWLVDLINYNERAKEIEDTSFDEDLDGGTKMFLDYLEKGYKLFLSGEDDLSPLEEEVALTFESKNAGLNADIEKLTKANELLSVQVKEFVDDNGKTPLQAEQESARLLEEDKNKYSKHMKTLQEHKAKLCDQLQLRTGESTTCRNDLAALRAEIEQHKATVAAQDLTPADVRRMHDERTHLEKEVESLQAQKDALSSSCGTADSAAAHYRRLEGKVQKANSCLLRLHMIKARRRIANGVSHELALNKHLLDTAPEQLLSVDTKEVLPGLRREEGRERRGASRAG